MNNTKQPLTGTPLFTLTHHPTMDLSPRTLTQVGQTIRKESVSYLQALCLLPS